jgi:hypothetical protein
MWRKFLLMLRFIIIVGGVVARCCCCCCYVQLTAAAAKKKLQMFSYVTRCSMFNPKKKNMKKRVTDSSKKTIRHSMLLE